MRLAALLLLVITGTHYFYDLLAPAYANPGQAARIIFYVARGLEGAVLFGLVWLLARGALLGVVCLWGFLEEAQTSVCQMANGFVTIDYKPFTGLCGAQMYWIGVIAAGWLAAEWLDKYRETKREPR